MKLKGKAATSSSGQTRTPRAPTPFLRPPLKPLAVLFLRALKHQSVAPCTTKALCLLPPCQLSSPKLPPPQA